MPALSSVWFSTIYLSEWLINWQRASAWRVALASKTSPPTRIVCEVGWDGSCACPSQALQIEAAGQSHCSVLLDAIKRGSG